MKHWTTTDNPLQGLPPLVIDLKYQQMTRDELLEAITITDITGKALENHRQELMNEVEMWRKIANRLAGC